MHFLEQAEPTRPRCLRAPGAERVPEWVGFVHRKAFFLIATNVGSRRRCVAGALAGRR